MVKCWAVSPNRIKCNRDLVECLASRGQHVGRKFLGVKAAKFQNEAWNDPKSPDIMSREGQRKLAAEIRRLRFLRGDASFMKLPKQYQAFSAKLSLLAGFVVKERRNRCGVTIRVRKGPDGTVLAVGQSKLGVSTE